jgi:NAD(P)-dependent dehydrogenase (short-subunit alcohol dehydrogenase family)
MNTSPSRIVVVTGASGAHGRTVVDGFFNEGAQLALIDRDEQALRTAHAARGDIVLPLQADVTSEASMQEAGAAILRRFGRVDVIVHIAGAFEMGEPVHELSRASWDRMMNLNAWSLVAVTQALVPQMLQRGGGGKVVAVSAASATGGKAKMAAYVASKAALQRLVESMSQELRDSGINVNSIAPTIMDTPANRASMPGADTSGWVTTEEAAQAIAYLASDAARHVHGQHLVLG